MTSLEAYLLLMFVVSVLLFGLLWLFKKSLLYKTLLSWGERELVLQSFGTPVRKYKFIIILITTLLAALAGTCYTFYYLYIDPSSFWFSMLILALTIVFLSYKRNELGVLLVAILLLAVYEYLRFFKLVEASKIGYFREMIFALLIIIVAFVSFKRLNF